MKKFQIVFFMLLAIFSGCKRKKVVQERLCSRVDLEQVTSLIPKTSEEVYLLAEQTTELLKQAFIKIDQISAEKRTYANTLLIYEQAYFHFFTHQKILQMLAKLSQDSGIQTAANVALLELSEQAHTMLTRNLTLYQALDEYEKNGKDPYRHIKPVTFFLENSFTEFAREGLNLSIPDRNFLVQLEQEMSHLSGRFCSNVLHDQRHLIVALEDLRGLSPEFLTTLSQDEQQNYILPADQATLKVVMQNCQNAATRRDYFLLCKSIGSPQNETVLHDLQVKRQEVAKLFGFENFAAYQLDQAMIKTPKKADHFLWNMIKDLQLYDDAEFASVLRHLPPSVVLNSDKKMQPWDQDFVMAAYQKKHFKIDDREISEYFPLYHVLPTMLQQLSKFFHVSFELQDMQDLWAPDILCYRVRSMKHQGVLGYLFFDLYARETKRNEGMQQMMIIPAIRDDCSIPCVGACVIVAHLQNEKNQTSLLTFADVQNLFAQMGYALHNIFGATRFSQFSGNQVTYDFAKVPSEVLKHWPLQPELLQELSHHVRTSASLNRASIEQLIAREKFGRAGRTMQQLFLSLVALHLCLEPTDNVHHMIEKLHKKVFKHIAYAPENYFEMSFLPFADNDHAASYYAHVWSEVVAADLFAYINKHGIFNHEVGMQYVTEILSPGGSRYAYEMVKRFLGHPFHRKAYLEELSI
jgi:peptidyl-dipeptidase Dcp